LVILLKCVHPQTTDKKAESQPATKFNSLLQEAQRHVEFTDSMKYQTNVALITFTITAVT